VLRCHHRPIVLRRPPTVMVRRWPRCTHQAFAAHRSPLVCACVCHRSRSIVRRGRAREPAAVRWWRAASDADANVRSAADHQPVPATRSELGAAAVRRHAVVRADQHVLDASADVRDAGRDAALSARVPGSASVAHELSVAVCCARESTPPLIYSNPQGHGTTSTAATARLLLAPFCRHCS